MSIFSHYKGLKRELYIFFLVRFVVAFGSLVSAMFVLLMSEKLHYSSSFISSLLAITTMLYLPAGIIGGKLADRFSRKSIILIFEGSVAVLYWIAALIPIGDITVGIIFLSYFLNSLAGPASSTLITDFSDASQRDRAFSMGYLGFNLGYILAPTIGGLLFKDNFSWSLMINGTAIFISALLILFFIHEKNSYRYQSRSSTLTNEYEGDEHQANVVTVLAKRKVVLLVILGSYLTGLVYNVVGFIAPLQLSHLYGEQGSVWYGALVSFNAFSVIVLTPLFVYFFKHLKDLRKMTIAISLLIMSMIVFGFSSWLPLFFTAMFFYTAGEVSNTLGYMPYVTKRIPASHRGRIFGTISILATIMSALSSLLVGYVVDHYGYSLAWVVYVVIGLIAVIIYLLAYPLDRKKFTNL